MKPFWRWSSVRSIVDRVRQSPVDGSLARFKRSSGFAWRSISEDVAQAVDYAGELFSPAVFRRRRALPHTARSGEWADLYWIEGREGEPEFDLDSLLLAMMEVQCATRRVRFDR